jgi:hypothetical protein
VNSIAVSRFLWNRAKTCDEEFLCAISRNQNWDNGAVSKKLGWVFLDLLSGCIRLFATRQFATRVLAGIDQGAVSAIDLSLRHVATWYWQYQRQNVIDNSSCCWSFLPLWNRSILCVEGNPALPLGSTVVTYSFFLVLKRFSWSWSVFLGPEACTDITHPVTKYEISELQCCPTCVVHHCTWSTSLVGMTYHDYIASPKFTTPDLIVAFNTGCTRNLQ